LIAGKTMTSGSNAAPVFKDHGYRFSHWDALHSICEWRQPKKYMEVGVSFGDSLKVVLPFNPESLALCDSWGGEYGGEMLGGHAHIDNLLRDFRGTVRYLDGNSHILLPAVTETFDLILVDGDHSDEGAERDLWDCWRLLEKDGLLVFDDIRHPSHMSLMVVFEKFCRESGGELVHLCTTKPMGCGVIAKR
jgi:SAM-dependent methyltransferase